MKDYADTFESYLGYPLADSASAERVGEYISELFIPFLSITAKILGIRTRPAASVHFLMFPSDVCTVHALF
jgi:hypothetical protein